MSYTDSGGGKPNRRTGPGTLTQGGGPFSERRSNNRGTAVTDGCYIDKFFNVFEDLYQFAEWLTH
jgi:hypothetical protein